MLGKYLKDTPQVLAVSKQDNATEENRK